MPYIKPTPQDLEDKINSIIEDDENLVEVPVVKEIVKEGTEAEILGDNEGEEDAGEVREAKNVDTLIDEVDKEDYELKFKESSREAQVQFSKSKKITTAIERANQIVDVEVTELQKEYPEWDTLSDFEQRLAKDSYISKKRFEAINSVSQEFQEIDAWNDKVDEFIEDPKLMNRYPELEGKEEEFKKFSTKSTRRGLDFPDLVAAFLYNSPRKQYKGSMFESTTSGQGKSPQKKKMSLENAAILRLTNHKEYLRLLKSGKI